VYISLKYLGVKGGLGTGHLWATILFLGVFNLFSDFSFTFFLFSNILVTSQLFNDFLVAILEMTLQAIFRVYDTY